MATKEKNEDDFWWGALFGIIGAAIAAAVVSESKKGQAEVIRSKPLIEMRTIINDAQQNSYIREAAAQLTSGCTSGNSICEISAIFDFVANGIKYMRDPTRNDRFSHPLETLQLRIGDCDCKSILLASLLETIGHETELVLIPGHVFVQVRIKNTDVVRLPPSAFYIPKNGKIWVPLESTAEDAYIGWMSKTDYDALALGNARYG